MEKYTNSILEKAQKKYKKGMVVLSPMTGKKFTIDRINGSWHREYIYGFNGTFFFDTVWIRGKWAKILE